MKDPLGIPLCATGNIGLLDLERGTPLFQNRSSIRKNAEYYEDHLLNAVTHTQNPTVTGTSVLGIQYKDGVMLATDTLCSYGSLARYRDIERVFGVGDKVLIGSTGELSDYMALKNMMEQLERKEFSYGNGLGGLGAEVVYQYLVTIMYGRRSKMNPLWNRNVLAGFTNDTDRKFLGYVDLLGTNYESETLATGFGAHIALPLLRRHTEKVTPCHLLEEAEAKRLLEDSMRVLYYRDARSLDRIQLSYVTKERGVIIEKPHKLETNWDIGMRVSGYGADC